MTEQDSTKQVLRKLLTEHVGRDNAITQSQLAGALGMNPSTLRSELRRLREERGIPIGNMRDGYYVIGNREELQDYVGHINKEIQSKKQTIEHTLEAFEDFSRDEALPGASAGACERCGGTIKGDAFLWFSTELCRDCYDDRPGTKSQFQSWMGEA